MDSVTQFLLGAAVGEAVLGRRIGRRALLWGGLAGTLPDLDVFVHLGDAVKDYTYHRSASHSLFVLAAVTPPMAWLAGKAHAQFRVHWLHWALMFYLVFVTHVLLDSLTAYGTQILWPFNTTPISWSTIFIIDPLYTLPLLVGVIGAFVMRRETGVGHRINGVGLMLSTLYLGWTLAAKVVVDNQVQQALRRQAVEYRAVFTVPTPFNSLLWRAVIMDKDGYYETFYSVFDNPGPLRLYHHPSREQLLADMGSHWPVQRLKWFSKGFYKVDLQDGDIVISDLRMGLEPNYVFSFKVGEQVNPRVLPTRPERLAAKRNFQLLGALWQRIWDDSVGLGSPAQAPNSSRNDM